MSGAGILNRQFWKFVLRVALYTFIGWVVLSMNPFGIGDRADEATQDAFYQVVSPYYPAKARDDIVVVLFNDRSIRELSEHNIIAANEWPILYQDHGYLLSRIMKYQPRAVFVDIYFKQERSIDPSFEAFSRRVGRSLDDSGTRLLFAAGYGYTGELATGIQQKLAAIGSMVVNGWSGYGRAYPLRHQTRTTAAYELYSLACRGKSPLSCSGPVLEPIDVDSGDAMSVRWGGRPATPVFEEFSRDECRSDSNTHYQMAAQLVKGVLQDIVDYNGAANPDKERCPYHTVLYVDELVYVDKHDNPQRRERLKTALKDKIVLFGMDLEGVHDRVDSPVHDSLPGVFFHAMALDNLMTYGADYIQASNERMNRLNLGIWFAMVVILSVLLYFLEKHGVPMTASPQQDKGSGLKGMLRGNPRVFLFGFFTVLIILASILLFRVMRYEPVNSIAFFALSGIVSLLVYRDIVDRFIGWLKTRDIWKRTKAGPD